MSLLHCPLKIAGLRPGSPPELSNSWHCKVKAAPHPHSLTLNHCPDWQKIPDKVPDSLILLNIDWESLTPKHIHTYTHINRSFKNNFYFLEKISRNFISLKLLWLSNLTNPSSCMPSHGKVTHSACFLNGPFLWWTNT